MLYKYYTIELCSSEYVLMDINIQTYVDSNYNESCIRNTLNKTPKYINVIKYLDEFNKINDFPKLFYSYDDAYKVLNKYYMLIPFDINIKTTKIVEVLSPIEPPISEIRRRKLKKIL